MKSANWKLYAWIAVAVAGLAVKYFFLPDNMLFGGLAVLFGGVCFYAAANAFWFGVPNDIDLTPSVYVQIEGMISALDAGDALVFHATNLADAIKRNDNRVVGSRVACMQALLGLLEQYSRQADSAAQTIETPSVRGT